MMLVVVLSWLVLEEMQVLVFVHGCASRPHNAPDNQDNEWVELAQLLVTSAAVGGPAVADLLLVCPVGILDIGGDEGVGLHVSDEVFDEGNPWSVIVVATLVHRRGGGTVRL